MVRNDVTKLARVELLFRFDESSQLPDTYQMYDYVVDRVPFEFLPTKVEVGRRVSVRFREKRLRLGWGKHVLWEAHPEDPVNKFWISLFPGMDRKLLPTELDVLSAVHQ